MTATVAVRELDSQKNRVILDTTCTNHNGTAVVAGEAVIVSKKANKIFPSIEREPAFLVGSRFFVPNHNDLKFYRRHVVIPSLYLIT